MNVFSTSILLLLLTVFGTAVIHAQDYSFVLQTTQPIPDTIYWCGFTPSGDTVLMTGFQGNREFAIWDIDSWVEYGVPDTLEARPRRFAFSPDGKWAASIGPKSIVWNTQTWKEHAYLKLWQLTDNVVFTPDGDKVIGINVAGVFVWDAESGEILDTVGRLFPLNKRGLQVGPDGKTIYVATDSGRIWKMSYPEAEILWEKKRRYSVHYIHSKPDGTRILGYGLKEDGSDWEIFELDAMTGEQVSSYPTRSLVRLNLRYNRDGSLIVGAGDSTLRVWDATTGKRVATILAGPTGWADFSPVDNRIVSGGLYGTRIWQLQPTSTVEEAVAGVASERRLNVYPNPVRDEIMVSFDLVKNQLGRLLLVNAVGREVAVLAEMEYSSGETIMRLDLGGIAAGAYRLVLRTDDGIRSAPVMVAR